MSASLFHNFTGLALRSLKFKSSPWRKLYWSLLLLFLLRRSVKRTHGRIGIGFWSRLHLHGLDWERQAIFLGIWNSMPKKKHSSADRKTRVSLVLLVAKENDLSLYIYIYIHTIYYNMFGWSLAVNRTVCKYVWRFACIPWEDLLIMSTQTCYSRWTWRFLLTL